MGLGAIRVTTGLSGVDMGAVIAPRRSAPSLAAIWRVLRAEVAAQRHRALLWTPVAFGAGAAAYLGLKIEPPVWIAWAAAVPLVVVAAVTFRFGRRPAPMIAAGLLAMAAVGFLAAKLHSDAIAAPIAPGGLGVVILDGWVVDVANPSETGGRLLIAPVRISRLKAGATPTLVRIVVPAPGGPESLPPPGSAIRVETLLDPPPPPAAPGAYDFACDAWFEGIGGVGLAMKPPERTMLPQGPWRLRMEMTVNDIRWRVAERLARDIGAVMGPDDGGAAGLAVAVTTSHQDWLPANHRDDLRGSGLAHMLAIAGLHTAALSGFAFFFFRVSIAAWPWLALRVDGKKVAAAAALLAVGSYLLLSGGHPPARRAAITAGVAFLAILLDRRAISLHSLAVAALIILALEPDVVVQPGFEMSFCATASLVALAEVWRRPAGTLGLTGGLAVLQKARDWIVGLAVVSFVAGAATGPFAIQHFNRVANYGVFANLTADFVASAVMMPALAVSLLAQLFGLSDTLARPALLLAGWAAKTINALGHTFAVAPRAAMTYPSAPEIALAISYLGIVFACLWRGWLRLIGLPMAAAVLLWPRPAPPVAWIAGDGKDAAVMIDGEAVALKPGKRLYQTNLWTQRRGLALPIDPGGAQKAHYDCNRDGCIPIGSARPAIAGWWTKRKPNAEKLVALCDRVDILVIRAEVTPPPGCDGSIVLRQTDFRRGGSAEVFAMPTGWRIAWSQPERGVRPWTVNGVGE